MRGKKPRGATSRVAPSPPPSLNAVLPMNDSEVMGRKLAAHGADVKTLNESQRANAQLYDQTLTTLSAAFLGASVSFISGLVPLTQTVYVEFLYCSWFAFALSLTLTLLSYRTSSNAITWQRARLEYLLASQYPANDVQNPHDRRTVLLNTYAGPIFWVGLMLTLVFAGVNIHQQQLLGKTMNTAENKVKPATPPSTTNFVTETHGIPLPPMQSGNTLAIYGKIAPTPQQKKPEPPKDPVKQ